MAEVATAILHSQNYAIHYLDNGGKVNEFSHRHRDLHQAIQQEEKRRMKVSIRYKIMDNKSFKKKIYIKFKISPQTELQPQDLYELLDKLSSKQLFSMLHG